MQPVTYNGILANGNINPVSVTLRIPTDRRNAIKMDAGIFAQDRWTISRMTINAGVRYDQFIGATQPETLPASTWNAATSFSDCADGLNSLVNNCTGRVQNWKDISPRLGVSFDVFGNGKTAIKTSIARYVNGQQIAVADAANPETTVGVSDTRAWKDLDNNGSPFDTAGHIQSNELTASASTPNFGKNIATTTMTDPAILNGWGVRGYNWEYAISGQHELAPKVSVSGGYYRRWYGNQTALSTSGQQLCGLSRPQKPEFVGKIDNFRTLASNFGGVSQVFQGFDVSTTARFSGSTYVQAGINAQKIDVDTCNAPPVGTLIGFVAGSVSQVGNPENVFCKQTYPFRPDVKVVGYTTLPQTCRSAARINSPRGSTFWRRGRRPTRRSRQRARPSGAPLSRHPRRSTSSRRERYTATPSTSSTCVRPSDSR